MLKRITFIAVIGILIYSCGQVAEQSSETAEIKLISELVAEPLQYDGTEVTFQGTITHICRHSGDKMRVNQMNDADFSIMVMLEDFQSRFSPEFEGRNVKVSGVLKTRVRNIEALEQDHDHDHEGEEGHDCASTEEAVKRMQERGITPDIVAFVEMTSYEVIEVAMEEEPQEEEPVEVAVAQKPGACC